MPHDHRGAPEELVQIVVDGVTHVTGFATAVTLWRTSANLHVVSLEWHVHDASSYTPDEACPRCCPKSSLAGPPFPAGAAPSKRFLPGGRRTRWSRNILGSAQR
jgi:hypothetical protein